ncbi:ATP-dependent DNA helicase 2 subunit 1 isoform X2 [Malaya genurostris]|uniref:ATP-dependent DNA helicase 2 subunit 1 isoform X2 n=1 Tax=Malaya genurostris TaxID=325434 RepID=UPI0026F3FA0A|nr:ATP-dependent DNA helicase 2 subunit 1 isoform X2 [Malaya genurostris]
MYWNPDYLDDEDQEVSFGGREGILALIDCAGYMFCENSAGISPFKESLELVEAMMRNKIVSSEKDLMGIVFYNTKHSPLPPSDTNFETGLVVPKQTAVFMPLSVLSANSIRMVSNLRESDDCFDFNCKFGHSQDSNLADVLWICSRMFTRCGYKLEQASVVLFTTNDEPHPAGSYEYQQSFVKAKDLQQLDVNVILVPLSDRFDGTKFYQEFLCTIGNENLDNFKFPQYQQSRERLLTRIFRRDFKKKSLSHLNFFLAEDVAIGVNIYSLTRKQHLPKKVTLLRDSNDVVISKRSYQVVSVEENSENTICTPLLPGDQRKVQTIGGEKITFTVNEIANMKQLIQPGLQLLGFKPLSKLCLANHIRSSLFLYPDENGVSGSTLLFRALYEKCIEKQKAIYCILTMRRKQPSKLVALVPQDCCYDDDGEPYRHNGFRIQFIPYAADVRNLKVFERTSPLLSHDQINVFKSVSKKIRFKYHPSQFENPVLTTIYTNIEALLIGKHDLEVYDATKPDNDRIDAKVNQFVSSINDMFGECSIEVDVRGKCL